jgi:catalase
MDGFSSHTFKLVNAEGKHHWVKFHFKTNQGIENYTGAESIQIAGKDPDVATRDLFNSIADGNFPSWTLYIQIMNDEQVKAYPFNSFDVTKVWFHKDAPLQPLGKLVLNRNPENYFAETEQVAFSPAHLVPGIEPSHDKMLQGRLFSYSDTHRHRLGVNFQQIPINMPYNAKVRHYQRDGFMTVNGNFGSMPNYFPNSVEGTPQPNPQARIHSLPVEGQIGRHYLALTDADFIQPGKLYRLMTPYEKDHLISNIVNSLSLAKRDIQQRQLRHFKRADPDWGRRIEEGLLKAASKL